MATGHLRDGGALVPMVAFFQFDSGRPRAECPDEQNAVGRETVPLFDRCQHTAPRLQQLNHRDPKILHYLSQLISLII